MGDYEKNYNNMDNIVPDGQKPSFDNFICRFAPLLISLESAELELIKMAYMTALKNNGQIDDNLLSDALHITDRTLRNRKNKIIAKINAVLDPHRGKTFPPLQNT